MGFDLVNYWFGIAIMTFVPQLFVLPKATRMIFRGIGESGLEGEKRGSSNLFKMRNVISVFVPVAAVLIITIGCTYYYVVLRPQGWKKWGGGPCP